MNKLLLPLLSILCVGGAAHAQSATEQEAASLEAYRAHPEDVGALIKVARLREDRGQYSEAAATWKVVQRKFANTSSRALTMGHSNLLFAESYNSLGARWLSRLQTRSKGRPQASASQRRAAERASRKLIQNPLVDRAKLVDMDADGLPELVYFIESRPDADGPLALNVDKWSGAEFRRAWMSSQGGKHGYAIDYKIVGKRWPTIAVTYSTDDAQAGPPAGNVYSDGGVLLSMPY